ncbi:unnamed protein product [Linum trigynum]|uniref:Uncharacterized protein n=1 Tax=Linum trigynum TaxID=586398 RepID=A0AAV2EC54_9ROSI
MSADSVPPAGGGGPSPLHQPDASAGNHRPPTESSSPNPKGDREAQHTKKRAKQMAPVTTMHAETDEVMITEEERRTQPQSPPPNAWSQGKGAARRLFGAGT